MLRCTKFKKPVRDSVGDELNKGPSKSPVPVPQMPSPPFSHGRVSQEDCSHLPPSANKKLPDHPCIQWAKIGDWNIQRFWVPFTLRPFAWAVTWAVSSVTWFHITWGWQFCFTASWFIILHLRKLFPQSGTSHSGLKKDYVFVNVFFKVDRFNAFPVAHCKRNWRAGGSHDLIFWMHRSPAHPLAI